jgi:hypothetical protein
MNEISKELYSSFEEVIDCCVYADVDIYNDDVEYPPPPPPPLPSNSTVVPTIIFIR